MTDEQTLVPPSTSAPTPTEAVNSGSVPGATANQADINALVGKARKEGKLTALKDLLSTLGVDTEESLKTLIDNARKREQADMSEAQKAQAERDAVKKDADVLRAQVDAERAAIRQERLNAAFITASNTLKANQSEDVWRYARDKHAETLSALITSEGGIDSKGLTTLLNTIKAERADYFTPATQTQGSRSSNGGTTSPDTTQAQEAAKLASRLMIKSLF